MVAILCGSLTTAEVKRRLCFMDTASGKTFDPTIGGVVAPFLRFAFGHPVRSLIVALLGTSILATGLFRLRIDPALESLIEGDLPDVRYNKEVYANFGNEPLLLVVAHGDDLFSADSLLILKKLQEKLESISGIAHVRSVFTIPITREDNGYLAVAPLIPADLADANPPDKLAEEGSKSPLLKGNFVSPDGKSVSFLVSVYGSDIHAADANAATAEIMKTVDEANLQHAPGLEFYEIGIPAANAEAMGYIVQDYCRLVPIAFLIIGVVLFLFFRSWFAVFIPLVTGALSIVATLGFMGYAGFSINIMLSSIVILLLVLGCTEDLHLIAEYADGVAKGLSPSAIFEQIQKTVGTALFLTSSTTALGFLAVSLTPITGLRNFALCAAAGITLNFVITILVAPALLSLFPAPATFRRGAWNAPLKPIQSHLSRLVSNHPKPILAVFGIVGVVFLGGAFRLGTDTNLYRVFSPESRTYSNKKRFEKEFGGSSRITITVETGLPDGTILPENFARLRKFHHWLEDRHEGVLSYIFPVEEFLSHLPNAGGESAIDDGRALAAIPSAYQHAVSQLTRPFLTDHNGSRAAFYVRSNAESSSMLAQVEKDLKEYEKEHFPESFEVRLTGEQVVIAKLSDLVSKQLVTNLWILAAVVAILISLTMRSVKMGLLALIPNVFPVVMTFGLMGWLGLPLNIATFPVAVIAFGVAVDDTIHLMSRFRHHSREGTRGRARIAAVVREETHPVVATSVAVCAGYLVLTLSPFRLNLEIGLLFTFAILVALISDLLLTPVLLSRFDRQDEGTPVEREPDPC